LIGRNIIETNLPVFECMTYKMIAHMDLDDEVVDETPADCYRAPVSREMS
jgi:hypothetical protein